MERMTVLSAGSGVLLALAASCATVKPLDTAVATSAIAGLPDGVAAPEYEPIWTAVLRWYRRHPEPTAGDAACNLLTLLRQGSPCRAPTALVLRPGPKPSPFSRAWLSTLASEGILEGLCTGDPRNCGARDMATYVQLADPSIDTSDAQVVVGEIGFNAAGCRPGVEKVYSFIGAITFHLRRHGAEWRVANTEGGRVAGNFMCSHS